MQTIDLSQALELLAELRVNEQAAESDLLSAYLLQRGIWIPRQLIFKEASKLARQRGAMLREWRGEFKADLAHSLPSIQYLN